MDGGVYPSSFLLPGLQNRVAAHSFLTNTARFEPNEEDWLLTLTDVEIEWFLQVLNDLRVGSWLALDSPEQDDDGSYINFESVTAENVTDIWPMEICGALQYELLKALHEDPERKSACDGAIKHAIAVQAGGLLGVGRRGVDERAQPRGHHLQRSGLRQGGTSVTGWRGVG